MTESCTRYLTDWPRLTAVLQQHSTGNAPKKHKLYKKSSKEEPASRNTFWVSLMNKNGDSNLGSSTKNPNEVVFYETIITTVPQPQQQQQQYIFSLTSAEDCIDTDWFSNLCHNRKIDSCAVVFLMPENLIGSSSSYYKNITCFRLKVP